MSKHPFQRTTLALQIIDHAAQNHTAVPQESQDYNINLITLVFLTLEGMFPEVEVWAQVNT